MFHHVLPGYLWHGKLPRSSHTFRRCLRHCQGILEASGGWSFANFSPCSFAQSGENRSLDWAHDGTMLASGSAKLKLIRVAWANSLCLVHLSWQLHNLRPYAVWLDSEAKMRPHAFGIVIDGRNWRRLGVA